jgi:Protein of unknown function (DUF3568)
MRGLFYVGAVLLLSCGGCALIPLATLGTVFGIAGTAVSTGPEVYALGKLDRAVMASDGDCRRAIRAAAGDLRLRIAVDGKRACGQKWEFELRDERKSEIEITVERRTAMLCRVRVDVGVFGSEAIARLVMEVIESHLPHAATRPAHEEG